MATPLARPTATPDGESRADRRSAARLAVRGLWCDKGQVIDLSARGMRLKVHRRWTEGRTRTLTIVDHGDAIPVVARCVWCRQEGLFAHHVGLAFDHVDDETASAIERLAERHIVEG